MIGKIWQKGLIPLSLILLLSVSACGPKPPSQFDAAQKESTGKNAKPAVVKESTEGGSFNKYFPKADSGYSVTFAQEKPGLAEAKLKKGGKEVAALSISDTLNDPASAKKYDKSTKKIGGYPAVDIGKNSTAVLVKKHYQVKVSSKDKSFAKTDREAWIEKFNLQGLESLK
ncbi:MAG TPA: hypothetical protein V6C58_28610 [Allocoleopsis sp.]